MVNICLHIAHHQAFINYNSSRGKKWHKVVTNYVSLPLLVFNVPFIYIYIYIYMYNFYETSLGLSNLNTVEVDSNNCRLFFQLFYITGACNAFLVFVYDLIP